MAFLENELYKYFTTYKFHPNGRDIYKKRKEQHKFCFIKFLLNKLKYLLKFLLNKLKDLYKTLHNFIDHLYFSRLYLMRQSRKRRNTKKQYQLITFYPRVHDILLGQKYIAIKNAIDHPHSDRVCDL